MCYKNNQLYFLWDTSAPMVHFAFLCHFNSKVRCLLILLSLSVVFLCSSCINGPVRCHFNGRFNYLTAETARQAAWYTYPITLPAAALCDTGILLADTVAIPVVSLGGLGPDGKGHPFWSIFWLPLYPPLCVVKTFQYGKCSPDEGVLYQWLFKCKSEHSLPSNESQHEK